MNRSRRGFLLGSALAGAAGLSAQESHRHHPPAGAGPKRAAKRPPVEMPDLERLEWTLEDGVKVFHVTADVVKREFLPGKMVDCWGFNGSMPGPLVELEQGDRVRFVVENRLPEVFSIHWHGIELPFEMDGVPGLVQDPIRPGGTFTYEFTVHQHGTFFYHSHMPMQEMMGMIGMMVIHPAESYDPPADRDFGLILQEWAILPNNTIPNTLSMEFNWLTLNGKAGPDTTPMLVKLGERVRIRMINLGMDHHPMHLHGNTFCVTGTEGGRVPRAAWTPQNTVLVGVAQARDVEFEAKYPGDWMLHCHLPHHMMNQMASMVGPIAQGGPGVRAGKGMEEGMGMVREGHALSDINGPSLGRALGVGAALQERVTHAPLDPAAVAPHAQHAHAAAGESAQNVPGFPQDMFMVMDDEIRKPEVHGLRPTWTAGMMGMMTLVRVLTPEKFDEIERLRQTWKPEKRKAAPHIHGRG